MSSSDKLRTIVRERYNFQCGYCGIREIDVGGNLEIEHFQPRSHGGSDELDNLVYSCTTCNRFKASYWPKEDSPGSFHLLHPLHDNLEQHISLIDDGMLAGKTQRGWFHIEWLQLNRRLLVEARLLRRQQTIQRRLLEQSIQTSHQLQHQIEKLQLEITRLNQLIHNLSQKK